MNNVDIPSSPSDLEELSIERLYQLSSDIRGFLIENVSRTGGHLASNLGIVELTLAIHRVFDVYRDRIVFDVGHQSYVHKILTGRMKDFPSLRSYGGISGFPSPGESESDAFVAGHASNSISAALGMARARTLQNADYKVACLIGDGALTGGLAFEAMNNAGLSGEPLVVILNDNGMSINKNVGAIAKSLAQQRVKPAYYSFKRAYKKIMSRLPGGRAIYKFTHNVKTVIKQAILHCSMFEELGFKYIGPVDGHDIKKLIFFLSHAVLSEEPVLVHVVTKKGKGYAPAEMNPDEYHGVEPFDVNSGVKAKHKKSFSSVFGETILELAEKDDRICAITAAMPASTGLIPFSRKYPKRFFDEAIAEGHAVTMAAGMAKQGMKPVFAVYSSFLQRAFDMLIHDVSILSLPVLLAVDRAGIVGEDGATHQGVFDIGFLSQVPGMTVFCPSSFGELRSMLALALSLDSPAAVRYPRGAEGEYTQTNTDASVIIKEGMDITIVTYGILINNVLKAARTLKDNYGIDAEIIKLGRPLPLDTSLISRSLHKTGTIAVIEDCAQPGSLGEKIAEELLKENLTPRKWLHKCAGNGLLTHASSAKLHELLRLDPDSIAEDIALLLGEKL